MTFQSAAFFLFFRFACVLWSQVFIHGCSPYVMGKIVLVSQHCTCESCQSRNSMLQCAATFILLSVCCHSVVPLLLCDGSHSCGVQVCTPIYVSLRTPSFTDSIGMSYFKMRLFDIGFPKRHFQLRSISFIWLYLHQRSSYPASGFAQISLLCGLVKCVLSCNAKISEQ